MVFKPVQYKSSVSNGTGQSQDKPGRDISLSLCLGTKKYLSHCPGKRAGSKIPGQTPVSWDVPGQNHYHIGKTNCQRDFFFKNGIFFLFFSSVLRRVRTRDRTVYQNPVPARGNMSKSCSGPSCDKFLSLSRFPGLSRPFGNPSIK